MGRSGWAAADQRTESNQPGALLVARSVVLTRSFAGCRDQTSAGPLANGGFALVGCLRQRGRAGNAGGVKASALVLCVAALAYAPLQCGSEPNEALRRNETPDEALYGLAEEFQKDGNEPAWRETLEYLIKRYPNSRHAVRARQDLGGEGPEAGEKP